MTQPERLDRDAAEGDPFIDVVAEIVDLYKKKQADYGRRHDPYANVRQASEWGVEPWLAALIRGGDKFKRLQKYARERTLTNEGAEDSMKDLAVYALIALVLFREAMDEESAAATRDADELGGRA